MRRESFGTILPHASTASAPSVTNEATFVVVEPMKASASPINGVAALRRLSAIQNHTAMVSGATCATGGSRQSNMDSGWSQGSPAQARALERPELEDRARCRVGVNGDRSTEQTRYPGRGQDEQKPVDLEQWTYGRSQRRNEHAEIGECLPFVPEVWPRGRMCGDHPRHGRIEGQVARRRSRQCRGRAVPLQRQPSSECCAEQGENGQAPEQIPQDGAASSGQRTSGSMNTIARPIERAPPSGASSAMAVRRGQSKETCRKSQKHDLRVRCSAFRQQDARYLRQSPIAPGSTPPPAAHAPRLRRPTANPQLGSNACRTPLRHQKRHCDADCSQGTGDLAPTRRAAASRLSRMTRTNARPYQGSGSTQGASVAVALTA